MTANLATSARVASSNIHSGGGRAATVVRGVSVGAAPTIKGRHLAAGAALSPCPKHVYQGPTSALEKPGFSRGKAGNAALNGVTALSARDIAYIACQTRFAISSQESWTGTDDDFSYQDFYWRVVDLLAGEDGQPILDRFNFTSDVFGTSAAKKSTAPAATDVVDEFEVLQRQRAAKRARLAESAAVPHSPTFGDGPGVALKVESEVPASKSEVQSEKVRYQRGRAGYQR
ncbi:hypothetical protein B0H16DRAFT_1466145 [Mycena metata]|uniref:Uncharacterized protein n=1 Tax=Mycena metata TaxID=1033252 RepID=A0AAD7MY10_9AGAR|nr:hypothetical protein B0H16DRAFT_1466145 [Mycena metata]